MADPAELDGIRRAFAKEIAERASLRTAGLVEAFAAVRREDFLGPGPWQRIRLKDGSPGYEQTPDDHPRHLYETNTVFAIDADRHLNNGEPVALAGWLDALDLSRGARLLHLGAGVGYYTAIAARAVSPGGQVLALEADAGLARRAARNLRALAHVEVRCATGAEDRDAPFDAIFVNAGATRVRRGWLDSLRPRGRLMVPLTVSLPDVELGLGQMLRVERRNGSYSARFVSPVGIFHCRGARSEEGDRSLREAFSRGGAESVRSLVRDPHAAEPACWLHRPEGCLSSRGG